MQLAILENLQDPIALRRRFTTVLPFACPLSYYFLVDYATLNLLEKMVKKDNNQKNLLTTFSTYGNMKQNSIRDFQQRQNRRNPMTQSYRG